ncbi:MAG TPA: alkaline phosphatase family protein, partial [Longimicrobiales bacterium]|nr:alkaline phosphatase family protein [Longimicrobiales bacterium]
FKWLGLKVAFSIWIRQLFTLAVSADLYRGLPAIYVNYLDYDVFAHAFGPGNRAALRALSHVDRSIGQLARVVARLPELGYDLYVLSDHGQAATRTFSDVSDRRTIGEVVLTTLAECKSAGRAAPSASRRAPGRLEPVKTRPRGAVQRMLNHGGKLHDGRVSWSGEVPDPVHVIAAGPNCLVYFTDSPDPLTAEEIHARFPGVAERLSETPGVGIVLARAANGFVCWWRGRRLSWKGDGGFGPFADRADRQVVVEGLRDLMAMPSAGDFVLYGISAPEGDVSFIPERGAHAGASQTEMQTFILHPSTVELPEEPLTHPIQLYPHFLAYRKDASDPAAGAARKDAGTLLA